MLDVLIVGAGISGLFLTKQLLSKDSDVDFQIFEARSRVGGRLLSVDGLDLGASWFWDQEKIVIDLVNELNVATFDQSLSGDSLFETIDANGNARSLRHNGNRIDFTSFRFADGAQALADALAEQVTEKGGEFLKFNTVVRSIRSMQTNDNDCETSSNDNVYYTIEYDQMNDDDNNDNDATTIRKQINAKRVVLTLPPSLIANSIIFDPPLQPSTLDAMKQCPVWMGGFSKVVALFDSPPFWQRSGLSGAAMSRIGPMTEIHNHDAPNRSALFGFVPPSFASAADAPLLTESVVRQQLARLFHDYDYEEPTKVLIQSWFKEDFTSPPTVFGLDDYNQFGNEIFRNFNLLERKNIFLSSTETSLSFPGHIAGALTAALRTFHQLNSISD